MLRNMKKQLAPLRKIVESFVTDEGFERERLECGHVISRKQDIYGPTNADRRRCRFCLWEQTEEKGEN